VYASPRYDNHSVEVAIASRRFYFLTAWLSGAVNAGKQQIAPCLIMVLNVASIHTSNIKIKVVPSISPPLEMLGT